MSTPSSPGIRSWTASTWSRRPIRSILFAFRTRQPRKPRRRSPAASDDPDRDRRRFWVRAEYRGWARCFPKADPAFGNRALERANGGAAARAVASSGEGMMADAAHAKPHHDYHLAKHTPWPAIGSVSAFVTAFGLILWMHHIVVFAPLIFGLGAIGVLYTMIGWWRDVIYEAEVEHD